MFVRVRTFNDQNAHKKMQKCMLWAYREWKYCDLICEYGESTQG